MTRHEHFDYAADVKLLDIAAVNVRKQIGKIIKKSCSSKDKIANRGSSRTFDVSPEEYYRTIMPTSEAAKKLIEEIGLSLPRRGRLS